MKKLLIGGSPCTHWSIARTTQRNFPDTIQLGDTFQVRAEDWKLPDREVMASA